MLAAQLTRFASVGALATGVHVGVALGAAHALMLAPQMANTAGFCAAVLLSYFGHGRWVFHTDLRHRLHGPRFLATAVLGLMVSSSITQTMTVWLGAPFALTMACVALSVPASTYLMCKFWVFRPGYSAAS